MHSSRLESEDSGRETEETHDGRGEEAGRGALVIAGLLRVRIVTVTGARARARVVVVVVTALVRAGARARVGVIVVTALVRAGAGAGSRAALSLAGSPHTRLVVFDS